MNLFPRILCLISAAALACGGNRTTEETPDGSYQRDLEFLSANVPDIIELTDESGNARIAVSARYQGRVMTSTARGLSGDSYGWINYDLIRSGEILDQFNPVGGEERFWIGPEGGQFSFYFSKGSSFEISNWQVPYFVDTVSYIQSQLAPGHLRFAQRATVTNYSGFDFDVAVRRDIIMVGKDSAMRKTGIQIGDAAFVAYETVNQVMNVGDRPWKQEEGLMSIWLLSMLRPGDHTVALVPFKPVDGVDTLITTNYFGEVPADRLVRRDSVLILKCDGKYRSKIGISPKAAKPFAASYDYEKNILSIIFFPVDEDGLYVNSKWELQDNPYAGDVVNAYNDGPLADGGQLGPFYELESSSAARELKPGELMEHRQLTIHLQGEFDAMNEIARSLLGVDLNETKLP
ncbi:MAG: hypothetical protein DIU61_008190 [Bacteroidota bacterium]|nr:MAG: hypothetical protein DIU61_08295 [Bacteroidota bacterium]